MQRWSPTAERKTGRKKRNLKEREEYLEKEEISGEKIKEKRGISGRKKNTWGKGKYQGKKGNIREKEEYLGKGEISEKKGQYYGGNRR